MTNLENLCCSDSDESDNQEQTVNTTEDNTGSSLVHSIQGDASFFSNAAKVDAKSPPNYFQ